MQDTLLRHWTMLRRIPRYPRKIATAKIAQALDEAGYGVSRRSLERDLIKLTTVFPLVCDDQHKPFGWSWSRDAEAFDLPGLDLHSALAFRLAAEHLRHLLPESTRSYLEPHFARAVRVLGEMDDNALSTWPAKVRVLPPGQALLPPTIDRDLLERVHAGLLSEHQLLVRYHRRGETELRDYVVHPHGLVWRGAVAYLICTLWEYETPIQLAVHRMVEVSSDAVPRRPLPGFSLDAYIASKAFDFRLADDAIALDVLLDAQAAVGIGETPLSDDQVLTDTADGRVRLCAQVADTVQLRSWLRSFGDRVEVLAPAPLRAEFAEAARRLAARYATDPDLAVPVRQEESASVSS